MSTPLQSLHMDTPFATHDPQAPPYSPTLINLNHRYNMSASSLTEALLLLSGMYISLVQPGSGKIKVGLHAVFPRTTAPFRHAITDPFSDRNKFRTFLNYRALPPLFDIATSYTRSEYAPKELLDMLCDDVFPKNTITMFYLNNHLGLQRYPPSAVKYLPRVLETLGIPIISYDTQFSLNARPALSLQLAPTMGQMMDVVFAFLRKFSWTDFSFLCTLSYGCLDEVASIRAKIDEFQRKQNVSVYGVEIFPYRLLSYVNFTDGKNEAEVREKLKYELHKDSRINLVHGNGAEVKTIMDTARKLGLTGEDYVWIFTAASITISKENAVVDSSYPLGSFIIGYDSSREDMEDVVKTGVKLWLEALNSLATSPEFESIDFKTGFSCDRVSADGLQQTNATLKSPLFWKYGKILYQFMLRSRLPGDLEFDEYGVLKTNRFWIMNVQLDESNDGISDNVDYSRNSGHGFIPGLSGGDSPFRLDGSFAARGYPDLAAPSFGQKRPNGRDFTSLFSPERDFSFLVPGSRDLWSSPDSDKGSHASTNEDSVALSREARSPSSRDRSSKSSEMSTSLHSRRRNYGIHESENEYIKSLIIKIKNFKESSAAEASMPLSDGENDSRLPAAQGGYTEGQPMDMDSRSPGWELIDIHSAWQPPDSNSGLPGPQSLDTNSELPKSWKIHSGLLNLTSRRSSTEAQEHLFGRSEGSISHSVRNLSRHHTPRNIVSNNTAYTSQVDSYLSVKLSDKDDSKLTSTRSLKFSDRSPHHQNVYSPFLQIKDPNLPSRSKAVGDESFVNPSTLILHNKTKHHEKRFQYQTSSHKRYVNMHVQQDGPENDIGEGSGPTPSRRMEQTNKRLTRAVEGKQIAKKIADWNGHNLSMAGIIWPGGSSTPPNGKPGKYVLKVVTWREDPHVIYKEMINNTNYDVNMCDANSLPCKVYLRDNHLHRTNGTKYMCCTGLCVDLLKKLSEMLHFEVMLSEVPDGSYGSPLDKNLSDWSGMLGMLIHNEADMAIGALSITPERSLAVDFSIPFLQTGIAIIVAIREGVISPTAFLEPYDYPSWSLILVFSVHATGASIFVFEWLSPYGLDQGKASLSVHKFSLFRSFWLIWAMLFGASVSTDQPRGIASRFLANMWALFAVVFCASYTANLAAFMITKDDYYDLSGIQDWRLKNPHHRQPPFKFATIANSSTDLNIEKNYREIHRYMKTEAQTDVKEAIKNLKRGHIQAFIYDSTTLEYEVGKDDFCKLKTVGKRIAETGYGVAFPKRSQWVQEVNKALLQLQENGDIERLQKFWLAGACHKKKDTGVSSHTLGILNFTSAFILLGAGVVLGVVLLLLEHVYFRFGRKSLKKWDKCGCCSLVSLSMGKSLTFEQSVREAIDYHKHHKCKDPLCETQLWKVRHDLDLALLKISQLRKQLAYSASSEAITARGYTAPTKETLDTQTHQNGSARKRRQQASDVGKTEMNKSSNQPLLTKERKTDIDDDDMSHQSGTYVAIQFQPETSSVTKHKVPAKECDIPLQRIYTSYNKTQNTGRSLRTTVDSPSMERLTAAPESIRLSDTDLQLQVPSSNEVSHRYVHAPVRGSMALATLPSLTQPATSLVPPTLSVSPHEDQSDTQNLSAMNTSNMLSSSDYKHSAPIMSDSQERLSHSCSEAKSRHLKSSDAFPRFSDEGHSKITSQDVSPKFSSDPDILRSSECNTLPTNRFSDNRFQAAHTKNLGRHSNLVGNSKVKMMKSNPLQFKTDTSDVNKSRKVDNFYVNVDEIIGKETSF